jgi:RNA polymerase sigma-70 factor (ECF subfamily)
MEAFGTLVGQYAPQARRVARAVLGDPDDGDDAAQDAFLSALKNLGRYDPNRPFGPWLMRIVANAAVDRRRRKKVRTAEALSPGIAARAPGPASETDRRAFLDVLHKALARLPERQRMAVALFDMEGYTHAEIAEIINVPQGTVRSDVFHGRRALRTALRPWQEWKEEVL